MFALAPSTVPGKAMSWSTLHDAHTKKVANGWLRVTLHRGQLFASNLGKGFGTRDMVFLLALLELLQR